MKGKMAIIGDGDSVLVFKAGGVDAFPVSNKEEAKDLLNKLSKTYQVIFITDVIAKEIDETVKKYNTFAYPIIISVPSKSGSNGYGEDLLKKSMEKALGVDIFFNDKQDV